MITKRHVTNVCAALLFVAAGASAPFAARAQTPAQTLVIQGGLLIDGTGRPPIENSVIVIEGDRFKAVGHSGEVAIPPGAQVIDVRGRTVMPGFIDGHCHWEAFWGELYLHLGITTCVEIETNQDGPWALAQKDGTKMGKIRGPRIWPSGQALGARVGELRDRRLARLARLHPGRQCRSGPRRRAGQEKRRLRCHSSSASS